MLPRPATTPWSSSAALIGVRLPASAAPSTAGVKPSSSGSGPRPASSLWRPSSAVGTKSTQPKRRGSTKPIRVPSAVSITRCSCASGGPLWPRASENRPVGPIQGTRGPSIGRATSRPDMPRWINTLSPVSRRASMYFPRRRKPVTVAPVRRRARPSGKGQRRPSRVVSARAMRRPSSTAARPRITVSTSGSSGMRLPCPAAWLPPSCRP